MARITEARITKAETLAGQSGGGSLNTAEQAELARLEDAATAIEGEKIRSGTMHRGRVATTGSTVTRSTATMAPGTGSWPCGGGQIRRRRRPMMPRK